jgi:ketosteroid isomerase-like protein
MEDAGRLFRRMDAQETIDLERATGLLIADEEDWSQEDYGRVVAYLRRKALTPPAFTPNPGQVDKGDHAMSVEANKTVTRKYVEAWMTADEARRTAVFHEILAPAFVDDMPQGQRTRDVLVREATAFHAANADVRLEIDQMVAEGDWVACRVTLQYTDRATGRPVIIWNPFFARVVDGQLVEGTGYYDRLGVLEQTGKYVGSESGTLV